MRRRHFLPASVALFFLAVSLTAVQPMLLKAKKSVATGRFALDASGIATVINNKNTKQPANLTVNGLVRTDGKDGKNVKLFELNNTITIGPETFPLTNGQGEYIKKNGNIEIEKCNHNVATSSAEWRGSVHREPRPFPLLL